MSNELLSTISESIENGISNVLIETKPRSLYEPAHYTLQLKAKRIRPLLVCLSAGSINGDWKKALPAALSIEMLHNFTLIHDDIMDNADTRRGMPSVFKKWDVSTAILSGDALYAQSYAQLRALNIDSDSFIKVFDEFNTAVITVCEGQAVDMDFESRDDVTVSEYEDMIYAKTGALLFASMRIGGIIGQASQDQIDTLGLIARKMGIAFQMQDDLLDAIGDAEKFGKIKGGDIIAGKKTFLMLDLLSKVSGNEKSKIHSTIDAAKSDSKAVNQVIDYMREFGVIAESEQKVEYLYNQCFEAIKKLPSNEYSSSLSFVIEQLKNRDH